MATRGPQVVLEGRARTIARGGGGRTMRDNIAAMDALVAAGLTPDGNTVDGKTRSGQPAYDHVIAQFPREELAKWEIPAPLLQGLGSGTSGNVKDFGAIMDGQSHPLSQFFPSLGAAQVIYPHATSLNDELDWAAFQAAVNVPLTAISVPTGTAIFNRPVVSGTVPLAVYGAGMGATILVQITAGADCWDHNGFQFQMFGMELRCQGVGGTAIRCNFAGPGTLYTLQNLSIAGYGSSQSNYWHDGIVIYGCSRGLIDRVVMSGIQPGGTNSLATIGNAIYLSPTTTPTNAISVIMEISNCILTWYNTGIILDSSGRTGLNDIQGVVINWVNCQNCMQFISVLGNVLEVVVDQCQYAGFGPIIAGEAIQSIAVWNSFFIAHVASTFSGTISPPPDLFHMLGGSNWWVGNNRFLIQGAALGYVFNLLQDSGSLGANSLVARDNSILVNPTKNPDGTYTSQLLGFMHIGSGSHHVTESGTAFGNWQVDDPAHVPPIVGWPYVVNDNALGGTGNVIAFGSLATTSALGIVPFGKDQWQSNGSYLTWNYPVASGATALVNSRGGGPGGFSFYNTDSSPTATPILLASLGSVNFLYEGQTFGVGPGSSIVTLFLDGGAGASRLLEYRTNGVDRWDIYADASAEGGANAGSNLIVARHADDGSLLENALTINRATGQIVATAGITITSPTGPKWTSGTGSPSGVVSAFRGSMFSRTDGAVGSTLYVCAGGTTWNPVAGV